jgi:signal transduction histidine kinase
MKRNWSIRARILTLLLAPLVPLLAMLVFATSVALGPAVNLRNARTSTDAAALPAAQLVLRLEAERQLSAIVVSTPSPVPVMISALTDARAESDAALGVLENSTSTPAFRGAANAETLTDLASLRTALGKMQPARTGVDNGEPRTAVMTYYNGAIQTIFKMYESIVSLDDHTLARQANNVLAFAEANEMAARENALLAGAIAAGAMSSNDYIQLVGTINTSRYLFSAAARDLTGDEAAAYAGIVKGAAYARRVKMENTLINHPNIGRKPDVDPGEWNNDFGIVSTSFSLFEAGETQNALNATSAGATNREVRLAIVVGSSLLMLLILIFFSLRIGQALIRRVAGLRQDALTLALDRLPSVIARLRRGEAVDIDAETPPLKYGFDELGQLGDAFTRVQSTAIASAVHEANLRNGFNQVFLNIARRSQTLLHRQLALLDHMERRTTEPDDLEELFRIDHLATRMRRHSEDLVILAGSTPGRGWRNPVPIADVLRAAASEVEEYARIVVVGLPEIALGGRAVSDVVHLLAELLENATLFSPPDTQVALSGQLVPNGFAIEIEDRGLGMTPEAIEDANKRLASPPEFDPAHSSRLGLFVVARLASRHSIGVTLRRSPYGGITAVTLIPSELMVSPDEITTSQILTGQIVPGPYGGDAGPRVPAQRAALGDYDTADVARPLALVSSGPAGHETSLRASTVTLTVDGLPQRVRQASLARQMQEHPDTPNGGGQLATAESTTVTRTPEQMRSMLSSFQDGMTLGRRDASARVEPDSTVVESDVDNPTSTVDGDKESTSSHARETITEERHPE